MYEDLLKHAVFAHEALASAQNYVILHGTKNILAEVVERKAELNYETICQIS